NVDVYLIKLDPQGNHIWSKRFGDIESQYGQTVAVDSSGNIALTGYFSGTIDLGGGVLTSAGNDDMFLAKFDAQGNYLWAKQFGSPAYDYPATARFDAAGNIVLACFSTGALDFGGGLLTSAGGSDIMVAKFDGSGTHLWSKRFGDAAAQTVQGAELD